MSLEEYVENAYKKDIKTITDILAIEIYELKYNKGGKKNDK